LIQALLQREGYLQPFDTADDSRASAPHQLAASEYAALLEGVDTNGDGEIDFAEFCSLLLQREQGQAAKQTGAARVNHKPGCNAHPQPDCSDSGSGAEKRVAPTPVSATDVSPVVECEPTTFAQGLIKSKLPTPPAADSQEATRKHSPREDHQRISPNCVLDGCWDSRGSAASTTSASSGTAASHDPAVMTDPCSQRGSAGWRASRMSRLSTESPAVNAAAAAAAAVLRQQL
jgi:hypothetical protein